MINFEKWEWGWGKEILWEWGWDKEILWEWDWDKEILWEWDWDKEIMGMGLGQGNIMERYSFMHSGKSSPVLIVMP